MNKLLATSAIVSLAFFLCAENRPSADVHLRVTSSLPIPPQEGCSGIFTVTNTGTVAFAIVTDKDGSAETTRFYRESDEEHQRVEEERGYGKERKEKERREVKSTYYWGIEKYPETVKTLQPGESVSFECKGFYFTLPSLVLGWADIYKAEMYLGYDTWTPITISPPIGYIRNVEERESGKDNVFVFAREGTNQFLYLKLEDSKFKRVGEMKLGAKPQKEQDEDAVTFVSPDGETKKLTRDQARQIIREREQENQQE